MGKHNQQPLDMDASANGHDIYHGHRHKGEVGREFDAMCAQRFAEVDDSAAFTEAVLLRQITEGEAAVLPSGTFSSEYDGFHQRLGRMITGEDEVAEALRAVSQAHLLTDKKDEVVPSPRYYELLESDEDLARAA